MAYLRQAGEKALARSAHREAAGYFEQALEALRHLPENRETLIQAIDLRLALRMALYPSADSRRILSCLHEAKSLAAALDDPRRLGQIAVFLSRQFHFIGAYDQAIAAAQRALGLATAGADVVLHALANQYLGIAYQFQVDYGRGIDCLRQTVGALDGARRHERFGQVILPAVLSRAHLAWCHAERGTFTEGRALGDEGLRIAEAVDHPNSVMFASWGSGLLALRQGHLPRALCLLERAMVLCQEVGSLNSFPRIAAALGAAYTLCGRVADAVLLLTQAIKQFTATEMVSYQALCRLSLGEALALAGRLEEALALAEGAPAFAHKHQERGHQAYALRLLGEIAARREPADAAQAEDYYRQAFALAEALGMRPLVAHCRYGLGSLYRWIGRRAQACSELSAALELFHLRKHHQIVTQSSCFLNAVGIYSLPKPFVRRLCAALWGGSTDAPSADAVKEVVQAASHWNSPPSGPCRYRKAYRCHRFMVSTRAHV